MCCGVESASIVEAAHTVKLTKRKHMDSYGKFMPDVGLGGLAHTRPFMEHRNCFLRCVWMCSCIHESRKIHSTGFC